MIPTAKATFWLANFVTLTIITGYCFGRSTSSVPSPSPSELVTVHRVEFRPRHTAYGQVAPIHDITVRSRLGGTVTAFKVVPGDKLEAGQIIARIGGPAYKAAVQQANAAVAHARAQRELAEQLKQGVDHLPKGLVTRPQLQKAAAAVVQARSDLRFAQATLDRLNATAIVKTPTGGVVTAVATADGERVDAGNVLIQLQPAGKLWLEANYYGKDIAALHQGMMGLFHPADGSIPVKVTLLHTVPPQQADGAVRVVCLPRGKASATTWRNGEAGQLELFGLKQTAISVPTSALIMDQGQWWVMMHDAHGDHAQAVTAGPSRGGNTLITAGLKPGRQIVVHDAYLRYHHGFAKQYTPPD